MSTNSETNTPQEARGNARRRLQGVVVGDRMAKTISVRVERTFKHPKYGKIVRRHKNYLAHDEEGRAHVGDTVELTSCRPLSRRKRWRLERVLAESRLVEGATAEDARPEGLLAAEEAGEGASS